MTTPLDLDAIRERADAARQAAASGTTGLPPNIDGLSISEALDIFAESAEDVPWLLTEVERLRAERDRLAAENTKLSSLLAYARESRDAYAATLDRVAAIVEPPHIATLENLSEVIDCARAAIEGTDS